MSSKFGLNTTGADVVAAYPERANGRVFLITGPSPRSIGEATAVALAAAHPAKIILVGRNPDKYRPAVDAIKAVDANIDAPVYGIDLGSIASVREGALKIAGENERIDVLINNAGIMGGPFSKTVDGIESHFATNHLGHFLLTNMLMHRVLKSDDPRIINLTSAGHFSGTGDYSDYNFEKRPYVWQPAYGQSKLANIHFSYHLAKVLGPRGVTSFSVHPGTIYDSNIFGTLSTEEYKNLQDLIAKSGGKPKTLQEGAATTLVAALDPELGKTHNGAYLADCQVAETRGEAAKIPDAPEKLWRLSETLVNETFAY
ncbi:WW domain-containing oxidoreductase [Auricularia subglabra TFB-10046 SS5]|nr:WW domain-containing oxidoreductase [Auricularia subglabra TFB-10046 SS5]